MSARTDAQEAARWEALGPEGQAVDRLFTPASGALLARGMEALLRSDDGGKTWRAITPPEGTGVVTVSPQDHQLLYAAGKGVYRSDDGGDSWQMVSEGQSGEWLKLELSPADPSLLYGVALVSSPADYGTLRFPESIVRWLASS